MGEETNEGLPPQLPKELTPSRKSFFESTYLSEPYLISPDVRQRLELVVEQLKDNFPEFSCLTVVGGLSNGSYMLRSAEKRNAPTDLDFYLTGHEISRERLRAMAGVVSSKFREIGISPDPTLDGRDPRYYLNLDNLEQIMQDEDFNLLALPFQATFGDVEEAKRRVLDAVVSRADKQRIWNEIREYHMQSLSIHHGSWNDELGNYIFDNYYPDKIDRFELPLTPDEAIVALKSSV